MNTSEHALILELEYRFKNLLNWEGQSINIYTLQSWIDQDETAKRLLFPYIKSKSHYVRLYQNVLEGFYYDIQKSVKANNLTDFNYTIRKDWKQQMIHFIDSTHDFFKNQENPKVFTMN